MTTTELAVRTEVTSQTDAEVSSAPPPAPAKGLSILHVEDNPADAMLMQEYIRGILPNAEFDTSTSLAELTMARAEAADCAMLDLSLPDASGLEALIALRGMSKELPIIVLTGFEDLEVGLSALRFGADDYLVKNHVDGFTLERAVRYAMERRRLALDSEAADVAPGVTPQHHGETVSESAAHAAVGTHQVAVRIDAENGEYALVCQTCDWEAERGNDHLHSWRDRSLDWVLMRHVAFGDLPDAASVLPTPASRAAAAERARGELREGNEPAPDSDEPTDRRALLSPTKWLQPTPGQKPE
jgi:CheY-like chemotaxis protein